MPWRSKPEHAASPKAAVAVVLEGSAFRRAGVREDVLAALEEATGRQVIVVPGFSTAMDPTRRRLVTELAKRRKTLANYDWKEPRCTADPVTLGGLEAGVAGGYGVTLAYGTGAAKKLRGAKARRPVVEDRVTGSVALSTFTDEPPTPAIHVLGTAPPRAPRARPARIDVRGAVSEGIRKLPALKDPEWEAFADRLIKGGCPLLAIAVAETRLDGSSARKRITNAGIVEMERRLAHRPSTKPARVASRAPAPVKKSTLPSSPRDATAASTSARLPGERYSCSDLCGLHMVELCNNDKVLWSYYSRKWETTPCGKKRDEGFLSQCYEQQWVSGTFQESCVTPCEHDPEGRERLRSMLEGAGCLG
jgi:hypothetical protein